MSLGSGTRLGPYEILAPLGAGGMGEVYKARDTRLDRTVAIKVLPPDVAADPDRRRRFELEARAASAINHPHICVLHDIGREGATDYLVLEYLDGMSLAERLRKGPLPLDQAQQIGVEIADALAAAHRQGVIHRDLKPGNVMLSRAGAKLLDFGLAKLKTGHDVLPAESHLESVATRSRPVTIEGRIVGTIPYMAPEQLEGKGADPRTDIWALGVILYEMVTGTRAFEGNSPASLIAAILEHEPAPISSRQPLAPPALERVITRCLAKDPDERWASAHDVADGLRWISRTGDTASASRREPRIPLHRRVGTTLLALAALAAVVIVAASALGGFNLGGLRDRVIGRPPQAPAAPKAGQLVVAVWPFTSVSGDQQFSYIADLVTEALTNGLQRLQGTGGIITSASARKLAASKSETQTAAEALNVDRLVEGTTYCDGRLVRIEARLSDRQGRLLWSDRVENSPDRILDAADNLLAKLAAAFGQDTELERRTRTRPIDPRAHAALLDATLSVEDWPRGLIDGARQALALAPDYADAHRFLAMGLSTTVYFGTAERASNEVLREAREHAARALQLQPDDGLAFNTRAHVRFVGGDREGAEQDFRRALALAPGSGEVYRDWSWFLSHFDRYDECLAAARQSERLDPVKVSAQSGWCLFVAGRYAEAAARLEETWIGRGAPAHANALIAASYARSGQVAKASALRDALRRSEPEGQDTANDWWIIYVHLAEGDRAGARRIADLWWNKEPKTAMTWQMVAQMYGALDDADRVVDAQRRSIERCGKPDPCMGGPSTIAAWFRQPTVYSERIRNDPRVTEMIRKLEAGK